MPSLNVSDWGFSAPKANFDSINLLLTPAMAIALLCVLEGNSIGKSLAARDGDRLNSNQEMLSSGMANLACGLLSGMAASGSLTRSQLNSSSGAKTPISSLFSGLIVLAGAFALAPLIGYIPSASLAVVVVVIGISLLNAHQLRMVMKTTKSDSITFFVTFITGLVFALDFAIYVGAACSIALFIKKVANPEIVEYAFDKKGQLGKLREKEERADLEVSIVHVEGELFFGAAELFRDQMRRVSDAGNLKVVIMKLRNAHNLDATSCMALEELIKYMNERDRILLVSEVRPDTMRILKIRASWISLKPGIFSPTRNPIPFIDRQGPQASKGNHRRPRYKSLYLRQGKAVKAGESFHRYEVAEFIEPLCLPIHFLNL